MPHSSSGACRAVAPPVCNVRERLGLDAGRVLSGTGCGVVCLCAPRYLAEISPPRMRGAVGSLAQFTICAGILAAYCMGLPYAQLGGSGLQGNGKYSIQWWRVMLATPILLSIAQVLMQGPTPV